MSKLSKLIVATLGAASVVSCVNKDDYAYNPENDELQFEEYAKDFEKTFGEIPADQSFDFYASQMKAMRKVSRSASEVTVESCSQPEGADFTKWQTMLTNASNNMNVGTRKYTLTSPGNGHFKTYAVWYAGWYENYAQYNFQLGLIVNNDKAHPIKLFGSRGVSGIPTSDVSGQSFSCNPGFGADIYIPSGETFCFYISYTAFGKDYTIYSNEGNSILLYSSEVINGKKYMVIGFEDIYQGGWTEDFGYNAPDFNDIVLYIEGNPDLPVPMSKRFMCEDLGTTGDYDFNDVVVDVQPSLDKGKAIVTLQAAGGTMPSMLYVAGQKIGEVHQLLGNNDTKSMINTGDGPTADPYITTINVPDDFNLDNFEDVKVIVSKNGHTREIGYSGIGKAPCVIMTPIETLWMKETVNINKGYPKFFGDNWMNTFNSEYLYKKN